MQTEQIVPTVQYVPAPKSSATRHSTYCEGPERPQKRQKMTHHPLTKDKIIPYPQSETGKVEHWQPHQAMAVKQDDDQGARGTNAKRMMHAKSYPRRWAPTKGTF